MNKKWTPHIDFDESLKTVLGFLIDCRNKNILSETEPALYQAYIVPGNHILELSTPISEVMIFSKRHSPVIDNIRNKALRLLSVALKAHYFMHKGLKVIHEPHIFVIPDIKNMANPKVGMIYSLEGQDILVADWDLKYSATGEVKYKDAVRFPVSLQQDSFKWLTKKKWMDLETQAKYSLAEIYKKKSEIEKKETKEIFEFGYILDYPSEMKNDMYLVGGIWANGNYFLPFGWDIDAVNEYLTCVKSKLPVKIKE